MRYFVGDFFQIADCITEEMQQIDYCINRIIDFKEAEVQKTFVVKHGVDEDLDRCKYKNQHFILYIPHSINLIQMWK